MSGVGYIPSSRVSKYQLDTLASPWQSHMMDLTADPGAVGAAPNPDYLNLGDAAVREAYERRYGPNTAGQRFKRFSGGGNEVKSIWADALSWWHNTTERPTEVETLDALATNDVAKVRSYLVAEEPGWSPERRVRINDPRLPHGEGQRLNDFWGLMEYYFNEAQQVPPPPPPPVDPPPPAPTPVLSDPAVRAEELATLLAPVYDAVRNRSFWTRRLPTWAELWPVAKPLAVELVKSVRRTAGRVR